MNPFSFLVLVVIFLLITLLMTLIPCAVIEIVEDLFYPLSFVSSAVINGFSRSDRSMLSSQTFKVVFLGDSLVHRPYDSLNLGGKIQALLPEFSFEFVDCASNGAQIETLMNYNLVNCCLPAKPDFVLMFWHSDASDVDEASMTTDIVNARHEKYKKNVASVVDVILKSGAFLAISSTGLCGETSAALFQPHSQRFHKKTPILNQYTEMNRELAEEFNIPFMDIRKALLDKIPWCQLSYAWCVTLEGEHHNERGTRIIAKIFADTLKSWLDVKVASKVRSKAINH
jgi:hypothetical protein